MAKNGQYAAIADFEQDARAQLGQILLTVEQGDLTLLAVVTGPDRDQEWLLDYLESALSQFGFEQTAAMIKNNFAQAVGQLNQEYPPAARQFAVSYRTRTAAHCWMDLFKD
jgi:hypothetical protein